MADTILMHTEVTALMVITHTMEEAVFMETISMGMDTTETGTTEIIITATDTEAVVFTAETTLQTTVIRIENHAELLPEVV